MGVCVPAGEASAQALLWSHTYPGQSAPLVYGYGVPPHERGPIARYSFSPMDQALAETVTNFSRPLIGSDATVTPSNPPARVGPCLGPAAPPMAADPYQGAFGTLPGWSAPFDTNPVLDARMPTYGTGQGVFIP